VKVEYCIQWAAKRKNKKEEVRESPSEEFLVVGDEGEYDIFSLPIIVPHEVG
jgi:phosphatidate phosphatase APP1